jgi:hypothetical protein
MDITNHPPNNFCNYKLPIGLIQLSFYSILNVAGIFQAPVKWANGSAHTSQNIDFSVFWLRHSCDGSAGQAIMGVYYIEC